MMVVTIIGIFAAVALPVYQGYIARAKVAEGLVLASGSQTAIIETLQLKGGWPTTNASAGLPSAEQITGSAVDTVAVSKPSSTSVIKITSNNKLVSGGTLILTSIDNGGSVGYKCRSTMEAAIVPLNCRN